jgi:outer membrane protein assembly factor BamD (BamD/ComL family)
MITFCAARTTLLAALLLLAAGCSREQQDWRAAEGAGTTEAFAHFAEQHPASELANQARLRIAQLGEESDWRRTDGIATMDAYRQFLAQHPNGKWAEEARIRIEGFSLGSAPHTAQARENVGAKRTGVNALLLATGVANPASVPPPAPAPTAPAALQAQMSAAVPGAQAARPGASAQEDGPVSAEAAGGYGVQLGAFGSQASADREWQRLQGRFGPQLGGLAPRIVIASASTGGGQLYRLQAPASGEAQARALCDALKEQSQACVPVIPR